VSTADSTIASHSSLSSAAVKVTPPKVFVAYLDLPLFQTRDCLYQSLVVHSAHMSEEILFPLNHSIPVTSSIFTSILTFSIIYCFSCSHCCLLVFHSLCLQLSAMVNKDVRRRQITKWLSSIPPFFSKFTTNKNVFIAITVTTDWRGAELYIGYTVILILRDRHDLKGSRGHIICQSRIFSLSNAPNGHRSEFIQALRSPDRFQRRSAALGSDTALQYKAGVSARAADINK